MSFRRIRKWLPAFVLVAAGVLAVTHFGQLREFAVLARKARPEMLVLAALLQASTYVSVALSWQVMLRAGGCPQPLGRLVKLAIAKLFTDQAVPTAGLSGDVLMVDQLIASGVPRGIAASTLLLSLIGFFSSFALAAVAVLTMLWADRHASSAISIAITAFLAVTVVVPGVAVLLARKGDRASFLRRFKAARHLLDLLGDAPRETLTDKRLIAVSIGLNALVIAADAGTLWAALRAFNVAAPVSSALSALVMSQIGVTLAPVPLGLGPFEAASIGTLRTLGIPFAAAVTGTFVLRFFTLWLPLVPGLWITRRMVKQSNEQAEIAEREPAATAQG